MEKVLVVCPFRWPRQQMCAEGLLCAAGRTEASVPTQSFLDRAVKTGTESTGLERNGPTLPAVSPV